MNQLFALPCSNKLIPQGLFIWHLFCFGGLVMIPFLVTNY
uniref:Uncharacterized protein n=1 Tax=Arundo donax TaxID=35708 RepID=A0A0A9FTF7_ARUDO